jgi:hypothetical protein
VSKNSSKTAKNTEKWFSRNISGKTLYDELSTHGIGLLMKMSFVGKSNQGRKPTLTQNG